MKPKALKLGAPRARPRRTSVGVTGHRLNQLPPADRPRIARALARALARIEEAAAAADGAGGRFTLVSGLAEGADRYAAHAALARGWRLAAPLPFRTSRYLRDFETPESKAEFRALAARAKVTEPPGRGAYAVTGTALARADVLVALWNGAPPKGPGGTADVAARTLEAGRPVLWIGVGAGTRPRLILPPSAPRRGSARAALLDALRSAFPVSAKPEAMHIAA